MCLWNNLQVQNRNWECGMDTDRDTREQRLKDRVQELAGDVESPGTLRYQVAELTQELLDFAVVIAVDGARNPEWFSPVVRYKYAHFFSHWAVLAISRLADPTSGVTSIPTLLRVLHSFRQEGELQRDRWVARVVEDPQWRKAAEAEKRERHEQLVSAGGGPVWFKPGPGELGERSSKLWNTLTGREDETDDRQDDMEQWILDSARRPLEGCHVKTVLKWRHQHIAHQDTGRTRDGAAGFDVYPMLSLVRAYWAVVNAAHRTLLLADGGGLHNLVPIAQFNVTERISGGALRPDAIKEIEEGLLQQTSQLECWLREAETRWCNELKLFRLGRN